MIERQGMSEIMMKRPKLRDMTPIEEARFRLLQILRQAQRGLRELGTLKAPEGLPPEARHRMESSERLFLAIIAAIKPSEIRQASAPAVRSMLQYIGTLTDGDRSTLN